MRQKLQAALALLSQHSPRHLDDFRRDVRGVLITALPSLALYSRPTRLCILDCDEVCRDDMTSSLLAGVLVHEGMHARLHRLGFEIRSLADANRHEHICLKAELLLATRLPSGSDLANYAAEALRWPADVYSPEARRERAAQRAHELGVPKWLINSVKAVSKLGSKDE